MLNFLFERDYFLFIRGKQGSGPDRRQSPVGGFPFVCSSVCPFPPQGHPARPEGQPSYVNVHGLELETVGDPADEKSADCVRDSDDGDQKGRRILGHTSLFYRSGSGEGGGFDDVVKVWRGVNGLIKEIVG